MRMYTWTGPEQPPEFDEALASTYVGKVILVGITTVDQGGGLIAQEQNVGVIESVSAQEIVIALRGKEEGEKLTIPPVLDAIRPAAPGEYCLRSTGERVVDPDFISTWTLTQPTRH